jgi:hypothetical protein
LTASAAFQNDADVASSLFQTTMTAQIAVIFKQGADMAKTLADLQAQLDAIRATETGEATALSSMGNALVATNTALDTIVTKLQNLPPAGVLTQEQLDAAVADATDIAARASANSSIAVDEATQAVAESVKAQSAADTTTP